MKYGITFSHRHLKYLNLSIDNALEFAVSMEFDSIRLGCYWREVEKEKENYDFSSLHKILSYCEEKGQGVVMNLGVKSPRYPEFYWPKYLEIRDFSDKNSIQRLYKFIEMTVDELKKYQRIKMWQVENEPLDPSGPDGKVVPLDVLKNEIAIIKANDSRPILLTVWGNDASNRNTIPTLLPICDFLGLDIYYRVYEGRGFGGNKYSGIDHLLPFFTDILNQNPDKVLVAEMQAEPGKIMTIHFGKVSHLQRKWEVFQHKNLSEI